MNESFIFYKSFLDAVKRVPKGQREELYEAILEYGINNQEYTGDNYLTSMVLDFVKPQIDANADRRKNGSKGGRPRKKPMVSENEKTQKPMVIENVETPKPNVNDNVECKMYNDNENVECINVNEVKENKKEKKFSFKKALQEVGVSDVLVEEWLKIRKAKKGVNSEFAFNVFISEVNKAGITPQEAVEFSCGKQYKGFEADWYFNNKNQDRKTQGAGGGMRSREELERIVEAGIQLHSIMGTNPR